MVTGDTGHTQVFVIFPPSWQGYWKDQPFSGHNRGYFTLRALCQVFNFVLTFDFIMHKCVCSCIEGCICTHVSVHMDVRGQLQVSFFKWHPLLSLRPGLSLNRGLPTVQARKFQSSICPHLPRVELINARELNSASTSLTEPSPWSLALASELTIISCRPLLCPFQSIGTHMIKVLLWKDVFIIYWESSEMFSYCCVAVFSI